MGKNNNSIFWRLSYKMEGFIKHGNAPWSFGKIETSHQYYENPDQARAYSKYRPEPPQDLLEIIISYLNEKIPRPFGKAVDVGCGTGQSTVALSPYFKSVSGYDISRSQIHEASFSRKVKNVQFSVAAAECLPIDDHSIQLLTAGTSFHWFNFDEFFKEANRVLAPQGVLAIYSSVKVRPVFNNVEKDNQLRIISDKLFYEDLGPYRSCRVQEELEQFRNVKFPFDDVIKIQDISQTYWGSVVDAFGYIQSMSTFQTFRAFDSRRADRLLQDYQSSIMDVLAVNTTPERTPLAFRKDYFLILCRRTGKKVDVI